MTRAPAARPRAAHEESARPRAAHGESARPRAVRQAAGGAPTALIVDDEAPILALLRYNLEKAGWRVLEAADGREGLAVARQEHPDIVVLDWMLPSLSGLEICRRLRHDAELAGIPIIMLTARGEEADRVRGLEIGADDYLTKPFSPAELLARMQAVMRRLRPALAHCALAYADLHMDLAAHCVSRAGEPVRLGPREFAILRFLMENPARVFSREQLLDRVWGRDFCAQPRTVDVHIGRLRKALGRPDLIRTVRGAGYAIDECRASPASARPC